MTSHRRSVNLLQENAGFILQEWLQYDDEETNHEEQEQPGILTNVNNRIEPNDWLSDSKDDYIPSDHDSNSECSPATSDTEEVGTGETANYFYGRNRFKWSKTPPVRNVRTQSHDILRVPSASMATIENVVLSPMETFQLIFNSQMIEIVQQWTNKKLVQLLNKYPSEQYTFKETSQVELKGFLYLLLYSAGFKSNR